METESQMVKTLQSNNETLQDINLRFLEIYQKFKVCMVHEAAKTDLKGTKMLIVDQNSAGPLLPDVQYFGIEATHSEMCKFESKNSPGYLNISTTIKSWVEESPRVIKARQDMERRLRQQDKEAKAREMLGIFEAIHPTTPSPYRSHEHTHGINTPGTSHRNQGGSRAQADSPPRRLAAPHSRGSSPRLGVEEMESEKEHNLK